jgi:hypothetical protein
MAYSILSKHPSGRIEENYEKLQDSKSQRKNQNQGLRNYKYWMEMKYYLHTLAIFTPPPPVRF